MRRLWRSFVDSFWKEFEAEHSHAVDELAREARAVVAVHQQTVQPPSAPPPLRVGDAFFLTGISAFGVVLSAPTDGRMPLVHLQTGIIGNADYAGIVGARDFLAQYRVDS